VRPIQTLALLLLMTAVAASGQKSSPRSAPDTAPHDAGPHDTGLGPPSDPEAALAWVRQVAQLDDQDELARRLTAWPVEEPGFREAEETRIALTWRIRLALQNGRVEIAVLQLELLEQHFEGRGESPEGRTLTHRMLTLGIFEEALLEARRRIEGCRPDRDAATGALDLAEALLGSGDDPDRERVAVLRRLIRIDDARTLLAHAGVEVTTPETARPWVAVFADDFALGEVPFTDVLARWQREGKPAGLRVEVVPVIRGQVRVGIRLMPAESVAAEIGSIKARLDAADLVLAGASPQGRIADLRPQNKVPGVHRDALEALGLGPQDLLILLIDARGRIVARLSGRSPELRDLDPTLQRLVSR